MTEKQGTQNFANHARLYPLFHFFVLPVLAINVIRTVVNMFRGFSYGSFSSFVLALALAALALSARLMVLTVQDRVIRLEMRLRLQQVLPAELRGRIGELTVKQLIALRFAGDAELPALTRRVLDEKLHDGKAIKPLIQNWQPDFQRA
jgi:Family of unknown function (DUF6526)